MVWVLYYSGHISDCSTEIYIYISVPQSEICPESHNTVTYWSMQHIYIYICVCVCVCVSCIDQPRNDNFLPWLQLAAHSDQKKNLCFSVLWNGLWYRKVIYLLGCLKAKSVMTMQWHCCLSVGLFGEVHNLILAWYSCFTYSSSHEGKMQSAWVKRSPHLRQMSFFLLRICWWQCLFLHCQWHWKSWRHKSQRPMQKQTVILHGKLTGEFGIFQAVFSIHINCI